MVKNNRPNQTRGC